MKNDKQPSVWRTLIGLLALAAGLIVFVWLLLLWGEHANLSPSLEKPADTWGVFNDSPVRSNR